MSSDLSLSHNIDLTLEALYCGLSAQTVRRLLITNGMLLSYHHPLMKVIILRKSQTFHIKRYECIINPKLSFL